ncbi:dienelactone hydrolase family protein [Roseibacterium sp. SDUM158017]|uniref:alpha/beta hydrolase family protein n=1 Tax=Roseicyclus salinarum TaxID=3036773 RepID=UPI002414FDAE|nr:dienelactone hydrolase family protein [Roseibacterium sp. SDUM158017]MDG4648537.1 dienelactone hydrolase family protein [Roseibacterium sp. SDUM158017]
MRDTEAFRQEELQLGPAGTARPATCLRPRAAGRRPAILYCHAHGNDWSIGWRELTEGRPALPCGPYGPVLAALGFVVLCLDMPGHGARRAEGSESAMAKAAHWRGGTLLGRMLEELGAGIDALASDPQVDAGRIGALGLSMGATHAYWLAALDDRVAAVAHLCAFADMGPLIEAGAHDLHGAYMTVPGLLAEGDMGDVAAMIAPRPQFVGAGRRDPLTPPAALDPALARLRAAYAAAGASRRLAVMVEDDTGHVETPRMRQAVLAFLSESLAERGA